MPSEAPPSRLLSIGHGGWSIHFDPYESGSLKYGSGTLSHYGDTWTKHLDKLRPDAVGVDCTACDTDDLVDFAVKGPMPDPSLPDGTVQGWGERYPFVDGSHNDRDARLGNTTSLSYVALDVYVAMARKFGRRIFNPHTGEDI